MENSRQMQETLLHAWMSMEVCIRGNRLLSDLSMNEMLICNTLYQRQDEGVTATELCASTRLLKSQMNRVLNTMEYQGLICRERATHDKRVVYIRLADEAIPRYLREHDHVLDIVGAACSALGEADAKALAALMSKAAAVIGNLKEET